MATSDNDLNTPQEEAVPAQDTPNSATDDSGEIDWGFIGEQSYGSEEDIESVLDGGKDLPPSDNEGSEGEEEVPPVAAEGDTPAPKEGAEPPDEQPADTQNASQGEPEKEGLPEVPKELKPQAQEVQPPKPTEEPQQSQQPQAEQQQQEWEQIQQEARSFLKQRFALSDADAEKMRENPQEIIPELITNLYMDIYDSIVAAMGNTVVPAVVNQVIETRTQVSRFDQKFFSQWEPLKEHRDVVQRYMQAYRNANPQATEDELIQNVGLQAMIALKKPLDLNALGAVAQQQQPEAPQSPQPHQTFRPAQPAGGSVAPASGPRSPDTDWVDVSQELFNDI